MGRVGEPSPNPPPTHPIILETLTLLKRYFTLPKLKLRESTQHRISKRAATLAPELVTKALGS